MRAVSFVDRLELEFSGNICKNAIVLGDVDNDQCNELAVGNMLGDVVIFKGENSKPWASVKDLGMVACLLIGDILNDQKNFLVCISGEGWCHIFHITNDNLAEDGKRILIPSHTQPIPANTKSAFLADIDGDGSIELVLGLTDRVVRTYRWADLRQGVLSDPMRGKLVGLHKWEFANQIGGISFNQTLEGASSILVAQPGGTYVRLQCFPVVSGSSGGSSEEGEENEYHEHFSPSLLSTLIPEHHALASSRMRNPDISSEILGGIRGTRNGRPTNSLMAIATLDGTLMLVEGDTVLWSLQVDHQLFTLNKLDLLGDGQEEVIACGWDGQTYIINQQKQSVRFQFEEHVNAVIAGKYWLNGKGSCSCLVYATFDNHVYLYYNVSLSNIKTLSFLQTLNKESETKLLQMAGLKECTTEERRQLYRWCLYGFPGHKLEDMH